MNWVLSFIVNVMNIEVLFLENKLDCLNRVEVDSVEHRSSIEIVHFIDTAAFVKEHLQYIKVHVSVCDKVQERREELRFINTVRFRKEGQSKVWFVTTVNGKRRTRTRLDC